MQHRFLTLMVLTLIQGIGWGGCRKKPTKTTPGRDAPRANAGAPSAPTTTPTHTTTRETVTFHKVYPKVGTIRVTTEAMKMRFTMNARGTALTMAHNGIEAKSEKVLALTGNRISKVEVTYTLVLETKTQNGTATHTPSPVVGKTYVVEARGGKVLVTTRDGRSVSAAENKHVAKDYKSLGKANHMLDAIPTKPVAVGNYVPAFAEALKKSFADTFAGDPKQQWTIANVFVKLNSKGTVAGTPVAILAVGVSMTMAQPGFNMTMHLKGTVVLRLADGWPLTLTMSGPLDILGNHNAGRMSMSQIYLYR